MKLAALVLCAACGGAQKPPPPPEHDDAPTLPHHVEDVTTLVKLERGDVACYVTIQTQAGRQTRMGDFDLCPEGTYDATPLIGQHVKFATRKDKVMAASCQGNPDCPDSESVDLVVAIVPAP